MASIYWCIYPSDPYRAKPTGPEIVGQTVTGGIYGSDTAPTETTNDFTGTQITGLAQGTWYKLAAVWYDGSAYSNVEESDPFQTDAAVDVAGTAGTGAGTGQSGTVSTDFVASGSQGTGSGTGQSGSIVLGYYGLAKNYHVGDLNSLEAWTTNNIGSLEYDSTPYGYATKIVCNGVVDPYLWEQVTPAGGLANKTFAGTVRLWTDSGQPTTDGYIRLYGISWNDSESVPVTFGLTPQEHQVINSFEAGETDTSFRLRIDPPQNAAAGEYIYAQWVRIEETTGLIKTGTGQVGTLTNGFSSAGTQDVGAGTGQIGQFSVNIVYEGTQGTGAGTGQSGQTVLDFVGEGAQGVGAGTGHGGSVSPTFSGEGQAGTGAGTGQAGLLTVGIVVEGNESVGAGAGQTGTASADCKPHNRKNVNLVTNGTFDSDIAGWTAASNAILTWDGTNQLLNIENGSANLSWAYQNITISSSVQYELGATKKLTGANLRVTADSGTTPNYLGDYFYLDLPSGTVEGAFISSGTNVCLGLAVQSNALGADVDVDDVYLRETYSKIGTAVGTGQSGSGSFSVLGEGTEEVGTGDGQDGQVSADFINEGFEDVGAGTGRAGTIGLAGQFYGFGIAGIGTGSGEIGVLTNGISDQGTQGVGAGISYSGTVSCGFGGDAIQAVGTGVGYSGAGSFDLTAIIGSAFGEAITQNLTVIAGGLSLNVSPANADSFALGQTVSLGSVSYGLTRALSEGTLNPFYVTAGFGLVQIDKVTAWSGAANLSSSLDSVSKSLSLAEAESISQDPNVLLGADTYLISTGVAWGDGFMSSGVTVDYSCYPGAVVYRWIGSSIVERKIGKSILYRKKWAR